MPAKAGIQGNKRYAGCSWTPAFAGVTENRIYPFEPYHQLGRGVGFWSMGVYFGLYSAGANDGANRHAADRLVTAIQPSREAHLNSA
jgi:hypothetical protein